MTMLIEIYGNPEGSGLTELRHELRLAMSELKMLPSWKEYHPGQENIPGHIKGSNVPALFINERNIAKSIYDNGLPSKEKIKDEILRLQYLKGKMERKRNISLHFSFFLNIFIAIFPKCPFCWAAYLSALGMAGSGILAYKPWLLPVAIGLLSINIISLYLSGNRHHLKPFLISAFASLIIILNTLFFKNKLLMGTAVGIMLIAAIWNALPKRAAISIYYYLYAPFRQR